MALVKAYTERLIGPGSVVLLVMAVARGIGSPLGPEGGWSCPAGDVRGSCPQRRHLWFKKSVQRSIGVVVVSLGVQLTTGQLG
jgi:hypothetical protein